MSFKLKISVGSGYLCQLTGEALAYQSYCGTGGSTRVFTKSTGPNGGFYFQDQDGNWLSHDHAFNCLYMAYKNNAVEWKIERERLIRVSDGAVLTYNAKQTWPWANGNSFVWVAQESPDAVTVAVEGES